LKYVRQRYGESLWNPLPREVAAFLKRVQMSPARREGYPSDEWETVSVGSTGELEGQPIADLKSEGFSS